MNNLEHEIREYITLGEIQWLLVESSGTTLVDHPATSTHVNSFSGVQLEGIEVTDTATSFTWDDPKGYDYESCVTEMAYPFYIYNAGNSQETNIHLFIIE